MRRLLGSISLLGLMALGCACPPSLGPVIDDPSQKASLLQFYEEPEISRMVYRTVVRWPGGRALSLTEVVKCHPDGGYSIVGLSDVGSTLYAVRVTSDGKKDVISKSLPFSDRWLIDGFVAELLVPWARPASTCQLHTLADGNAALVDVEGKRQRVYLFNVHGQWIGLQERSGGRLHREIVLEWADEGPLPTTVRVENAQKHYSAVREQVAFE